MGFGNRGGGGGGRGGGFRGGRGGGGFGGGRGGGRGGGFGGRGGRGGRMQDYGPPDEVIEIGEYTHECEDDLVCKNITEKVPYFNAPIYLENKQQIGKIDEIFGSIKDSCFSVKLSDNMKASSFKKRQKFYIDPQKLLPLSRFLNPTSGGRGGRGGRGGGRGGRGGGGGRGFGRGGGGGGFRGGRGGRGGGGGGGGFRGGRGGGGGFRGGRGGGFRGGR